MDGALLDGILHLVVVDLENTHFEATLIIFFDDFRLVYLHFLYLEGATDNSDVFVLTVFQVGVFLGSFPKTEHVVLLYVPYVALCQSLECQCFFFLHRCYMFFQLQK